VGACVVPCGISQLLRHYGVSFAIVSIVESTPELLVSVSYIFPLRHLPGLRRSRGDISRLDMLNGVSVPNAVALFQCMKRFLGTECK